jgi:hypothetical protein
MPSEREIDDAIDRTVRDIMSVDAPAGLRSRVIGRLERRAWSWVALPRLAAAGAAAALVVIVAFALFTPAAPAPGTVPEMARTDAPPAPPLEASTADPAPGPGSGRGVDPVPPEGSPLSFPPRGTVTATALPGDADANPPSAAPGTVTPPADDGRLVVPPIRIEPLTIPPITIVPLSPSR